MQILTYEVMFDNANVFEVWLLIILYKGRSLNYRVVLLYIWILSLLGKGIKRKIGTLFSPLPFLRLCPKGSGYNVSHMCQVLSISVHGSSRTSLTG